MRVVHVSASQGWHGYVPLAFWTLQLSFGCSNTASVYSHHSSLGLFWADEVLPVLLWSHHSWLNPHGAERGLPIAVLFLPLLLNCNINAINAHGRSWLVFCKEKVRPILAFIFFFPCKVSQSSLDLYICLQSVWDCSLVFLAEFMPQILGVLFLNNHLNKHSSYSKSC